MWKKSKNKRIYQMFLLEVIIYQQIILLLIIRIEFKIQIIIIKDDINNNKINGDEILKKMKNKMSARGTRGIMSIRRTFMIADDDNSKTVNYKEFKKFYHDYRLGFNEDEVKELLLFF